ncbi:MAG: hypothetical protein R6T92_05220 [Desulfosalsimonadaceae bacterium]
MVTNEDDGGLGAEVSSRLDELFAEDDDGTFEEEEQAADPGGKRRQEKEAGSVDSRPSPAARTVEISRDESPIDNLRALVAEIEWEITDDTMRGFLNEVALLKQKYGQDPVLSTCLKLLESIGKYIRAKKVNTHPDAIKLVSSAFNVLERIVRTPSMPINQQKQLLAVEVKAFKELKQKLTDHKRAARPATAVDSQMTGIPVSLESREALDSLAEYIVEKLKKVIAEEFEKIRRDLAAPGS